MNMVRIQPQGRVRRTEAFCIIPRLCGDAQFPLQTMLSCLGNVILLLIQGDGSGEMESFPSGRLPYFFGKGSHPRRILIVCHQSG